MIYESTLEEKAYESLLDEKRETLSESARSIIGEALSAAYAYNLVHSYSYQPIEYEEAIDRMRLAATLITDQERKVLAEIAQAGNRAGFSIDPDDDTTPVAHKVGRGALHWYYRMASGMVDEILQESTLEPIQQPMSVRPFEDLGS